MLFDKLCKLIETNEKFAAYREILERAKLFSIDVCPHEDLADLSAECEIDKHCDDFFLPFDVTAIEDKADLVILTDMGNEQRGLENKRMYLEFMTTDSSRVNFFREGTDSNVDDGIEILNIGMMEKTNFYKQDDKMTFDAFGTLGYVFVFKDGVLQNVMSNQNTPPDTFDNLLRAALRNVCICIQEVMCINNPSRFILQKQPVKRRNGKSKKIPRSHERPLYTILEPTRIREAMGLETPSGATKRSPHERRKHFRTYRSDYYKEMKGKRVIIPATWIGASEATVGKHHYKVMLDK